MAANSIIVELTLKNGEYIASIKKAGDETKKFTDKSMGGLKELNNSVMSIKNAFNAFMGLSFVQTITGWVKSIVNFGIECIQVSERADDFRRQLIMLTGSVSDTEIVLRSIREVAALGVFSRQELKDQARELLVMGESAHDVGRILNDLGNYAAGTGQGLEELTTAYGRMAASGQVNFRVIRTFGHPVLEQLARDLYGSSDATDRVTAALQNGQITFEQVRRAIDELTNGAGRFSTAMIQNADDSDAQMNRLKNNWTDIKRVLGENIFEPAIRFMNIHMNMVRNYIQAMANFYTSTASLIVRFRNFYHEIQNLRRGETLTAPTFEPLTELPETEDETETRRGGGGQRQQTLDEWWDAVIEQHNNEERAYKELMIAKGKAEDDANKRSIEQAEATWSAISTIASKFIGQISAIQQQEYNNQSIRVDNEYEKRKQIIEATVTDETDKKNQLEAIEEDRDKKLRRIKRKAAKDQKTSSIFETIINTISGAIGAAKAMSSIPYVGPALAAAAAIAFTAMGMAQVAAISRQPLPELYEGGLIRGTQAGTLVRAGERGQSEVISPLDKLQDMMGSRTIQLVVDGRVLTEVVDGGRSKKAYSMGAKNYSYSGVY